MGKSLFEFGDEKLENELKEDLQSKKESNENLKKENTEEAKKIYDKYKSLSQEELINEFVSTSKQKINEGKLSKEKINQTANLLSPYLNEQQKDMLKNLIGKIDV